MATPSVKTSSCQLPQRGSRDLPPSLREAAERSEDGGSKRLSLEQQPFCFIQFCQDREPSPVFLFVKTENRPLSYSIIFTAPVSAPTKALFNTQFDPSPIGANTAAEIPETTILFASIYSVKLFIIWQIYCYSLHHYYFQDREPSPVLN